MPYLRERLGELLVAEGLIDDDQLSEALVVKDREGGKLGEVLVRLLLVTEEQIAETLARQKGLEHVSLTTYPVDREAVSLVPERIARRRRVIPIGFQGEQLILAMADPLDVEAMDDVEVRSGHKVVPVVAAESQIRYAIEKYVGSADALQDLVEEAEIEADAVSVDAEVAAGDDVPIVRLVNRLLREAITDGASDVHIEPMERSVRIRYRVDGVLHNIMDLPKSAQPGIVSRVKVMSEMDIAERRRPQDGRIALTMDGRVIDLRLASLPTHYGESIVVRILNPEISFLRMDDLGMNENHLDVIRSLLGRPFGALLVAGPTGSGKTTSMYAMLKELNDTSRKIATIEDPVEYQMHGITQVAVNAKIGLDFVAGLRTMLRCDPDTVMVGEIRDPETAAIAIRAALTGHLVLSSIHTNDAPSALTRLVDMDVAPYVTSSALLGVVAQRLARRLCPDCKQQVKLSKTVLKRAGYTDYESSRVKPFAPVGCERCLGTGYKGRVGLFEIMTMDDELRRLFLEEAPAEALRTAALANGMTSLRRDALDKVKAGVTSLEEIERVVV